MEGSVLKIVNNVRITVHLIDDRTEANIWSEIYNRDMSDIFSIQSEVARAVARELEDVITPEAKQLIGKKPTANMAAYEAYWRGMLSCWKVNREDMEIAMEYFKLAIKEDPGFALAYAGIGRVWRGREQMGIIRPSEAPPRVEEAYEEHDPMLPYLLYPTYDILRNDPRFQEIAGKMNLPYKLPE